MKEKFVPQSYLSLHFDWQNMVGKREHCFILVRTENTFLSALQMTWLAFWALELFSSSSNRVKYLFEIRLSHLVEGNNIASGKIRVDTTQCVKCHG